MSLPLPLLDRVPFVVAAAVVPRLPLPLPLSDRVGILVALGGKGVLAKIFIANVSTLLLMIKDSKRNKQTNKHALDCEN